MHSLTSRNAVICSVALAGLAVLLRRCSAALVGFGGAHLAQCEQAFQCHVVPPMCRGIAEHAVETCMPATPAECHLDLESCQRSWVAVG